jgi:hypothetical protein
MLGLCVGEYDGRTCYLSEPGIWQPRNISRLSLRPFVTLHWLLSQRAVLRRPEVTVLIIAHHVADLQMCTQIVSMADGRIVQRGTPAQLEACADGVYASLLKLQQYS